MLLNFAGALDTLGPDAAFEVSKDARPPASYLFADPMFLPEMNKPTFSVESGTMTIRPTMAGMSAMDTPYVPGGAAEIATFLENAAKLTITSTLTEKMLREILQVVQQLKLNGASGSDLSQQLAIDALNFLNLVILQGQFDRAEWLRGQALAGEIDWTFNGINLKVNYGIPTANILTNRTGNDAYDGSASKFWDDIRELRRILKPAVPTFVLTSTTWDVILSNTVNNIQVVTEADNRVSARRLVSRFGNTEVSPDARDRVDFILYDGEGEIFDLTTAGRTTVVQFLADGKILAVGKAARRMFRPGQGAQENPNLLLPLGYTHIAPTVEGGGQMGRYSRLYTPENRPYQLIGESATNLLPVIENPNLIAWASTDMPA